MRTSPAIPLPVPRQHRALRRVFVLTPAMVLFSALQAMAGANAWSSGGPYGGTVQALAYDPVTPGTVYAGISSGEQRLFKSTDGGVTWQGKRTPIPMYNGASCIAIDPTNPSTLYACWYGLYKSTDGGDTWSSNVGGISDYLNDVVIHPTQSSVLYVATSTKGVLKSGDGGTSWTDASTNLPSARVNCLVLDPTSPQTLYAGLSGDGMYRTVDGGDTWAAATNGLGNLYVNTITMDPMDSATLYAGTQNGFYVSEDAGGAWAPSGLAANNVSELAHDPTLPGTLYAGTSSRDGIYKTVDGGASWTPMSAGLHNQNIGSIAVDPHAPATTSSSPTLVDFNDLGPVATEVTELTAGGVTLTFSNLEVGEVLVGVNGFGGPTAGDNQVIEADRGNFNGKFLTALGFQQGEQRSPGLVRTITFDAPVSQVSVYVADIDSFDGMTVQALGSSDVVLDTKVYPASLNLDGQLQLVDFTALTGVRKLLFIGDDAVGIDNLSFVGRPPSRVLVGTQGNGVFASSDGASNWYPSSQGMQGVLINSVVVDRSDADHLFAATASAGLLESHDGGGHWDYLSWGGDAIDSLITHPSLPLTLIAAVRGGAQRSDDGGRTWTDIGGGTQMANTRYVEMHPSDPDTLYAGTYSGLFRTTDAGASWTNLYTFSGNRFDYLTIASADPQIMYAADRFGGELFKSVDGGFGWTLIATNFGGSVRKPVIDPSHPNTVYSLNYGHSIQKSTDGGTTWNPVNPPPVTCFNSPAGFSSLIVDSYDPMKLHLGITGCQFGNSPGYYVTEDGGATWTDFKTGLNSPFVVNLTGDPDRPEITHAATEGGVYSLSRRTVIAEVEAAADGQGIIIQWPSFPGSTYAVSRTRDVASEPFNIMTGGIAATPPMNAYTITATRAVASGFRVEEED